MGAFFAEYGLFLLKLVTVFVGLGVMLAAIGRSIARSARSGGGGGGSRRDRLVVEKLNDRYDRLKRGVRRKLLPAPVLKREAKERQKSEKAERKAAKKGEAPAVVRKRLFVLDFEGDMRASEVEGLRDELTAVLGEAQEGDEIALRLESPGGLVHAYGLASSQLERARRAGVPLTVLVDKVAASGGYMMACVADHIVAAPFSVVGSIGVVAGMPNLNRWLTERGVDWEQHTAGEYKRTLTVFGENTEAGRAKFKDDLERTHGLFKAFVSKWRGEVEGFDVEAVATGEIWYGQEAQALGLVDEVATSDEWLVARAEESDLIRVKVEPRRGLPERLGLAAARAGDSVAARLWSRAQEQRFG